MLISEYEKIRSENIARNQEFLSSLGMNISNQNPTKICKSRTNSRKIRDIQPIYENLRRSTRLLSTESVSKDMLDDSIQSLQSLSKRLREENGEDEEDNNSSADNSKQRQQQQQRPNKKSTISIRPEPSSDSSRALNANVDKFLTTLLGQPIGNYGKAAVMMETNHGRLPRFSKYSGVVEWKNCVFLWVNIFHKSQNENSQYPNEFLEQGRFIRWFGGSKMTEDSDVIQRLLKCQSGVLFHDQVILFVRIEGGNYACLGRLGWKSYDCNQNPVTFVWELLDYSSISHLDYFQTLLTLNLSK